MFNQVPGWPTLWQLGNSRAAKSTGVWLIVVPVVAKAVIEADALDVVWSSMFGQPPCLALPFRWKLLYASALFIGAGTLLYHLWCPPANKYRDYASFKAQGKVGRNIVGLLQLILRDERGHRHLCSRGDVLVTFLNDYTDVKPTGMSPETMARALEDRLLIPEKENEAFWYVWHFAERTRPLRRTIVTVLYVLGFACLAWVLGESVVWVWGA